MAARQSRLAGASSIRWPAQRVLNRFDTGIRQNVRFLIAPWPNKATVGSQVDVTSFWRCDCVSAFIGVVATPAAGNCQLAVPSLLRLSQCCHHQFIVVKCGLSWLCCHVKPNPLRLKRRSGSAIWPPLRRAGSPPT